MQFEFTPPLFHDLIGLNGRWYPHKPAVIDEDKELSWSALDRRSNAVANGLLALGVRRGDSVALLMENSTEYVEALYGVFKSGAVAVPLNLAVNEGGLLTMLRGARARGRHRPVDCGHCDGTRPAEERFVRFPRPLKRDA